MVCGSVVAFLKPFGASLPIGCLPGFRQSGFAATAALPVARPKRKDWDTDLRRVQGHLQVGVVQCLDSLALWGWGGWRSVIEPRLVQVTMWDLLFDHF